MYFSQIILLRSSGLYIKEVSVHSCLAYTSAHTPKEISDQRATFFLIVLLKALLYLSVTVLDHKIFI